jgi:hypothetical protein
MKLPRITSAAWVEETLTRTSGSDKLQFYGESGADNATNDRVTADWSQTML